MQALKLMSARVTTNILDQFSIPDLPIPQSNNVVAPAFVDLAINELDRQFTHEPIDPAA